MNNYSLFFFPVMKPQGEKPDLELTHSSPTQEQEKVKESSRGWMQHQGSDGEVQSGRDRVNRSDDVYFHRYLWLQVRAQHKTPGAGAHTLGSADTDTHRHSPVHTHIHACTHSYMHTHTRTLIHSQVSLPSSQHSHSQHKNDLTHRQEVFPRSPHCWDKAVSSPT